MEINFYDPLHLCRTFIPLLRQQNYGRVVNLSSGAGSIFKMKGQTAAYKISKVALNALTRIKGRATMAQRQSPYGIDADVFDVLELLRRMVNPQYFGKDGAYDYHNLKRSIGSFLSSAAAGIM